MKKILKYLMDVALVFICVFAIAGCGKDDDKDPGEKEVVTEYSTVDEVIASLNIKKNNIKQFKITGTHKRAEVDLEEAVKPSYENLEWDVRNISASIDFENEKYASKSSFVDESAYNVNYIQNENNQYVGYNKVHYASGSERFYSYLIGKDTIANELIFVGQVGVNLSKLNYADYNSLKNSYTLLVKEDISRYYWLFDFNININPTINLYKQNNNYIFEYKTTVDLNGVVFVVDSSITFNEEMIVNYKYFHSYETQYWYDTEEVNLNYSSGLDTSLYLTDFSEFVEEPRKDSFLVTAVVDGYVVNDTPSDALVATGRVEYTPGVKYTYNYSVAEGLVFDGWYLDPEYKVRLDSLEDCPSHDIIIYGKVSAVDANDTVVVTTAFIDTGYGTDIYVKFECVEKGSEYLFNFETWNNKKVFYFGWKMFYFNDMTINGNEYKQDYLLVGNADKYYIVINGEKDN